MPYQFKIQLQGLQKPPVWRRLTVPENISFNSFHQFIQAAFGWEDAHLYQFSEQGYGSRPLYRTPDSNFDDEIIRDSHIHQINEIFSTVGQTYIYIYDFGDNWYHRIVLESIVDEVRNKPICTGGKGACPPEDCGGVPGYYHLLNVLDNPKHPEHKSVKQWLGLSKNQIWDVNAFDVKAVNERIASVF